MKCQDHAWNDVASNSAFRCAKNSLTRRGDAPNKLLNLLEQLLHKIKANRRREIRSKYVRRCAEKPRERFKVLRSVQRNL